MNFELHPYQAGKWTDPETKRRKSSQVFKADWRSTLLLLDRETEMLKIHGPVVIEVGAADWDIAQSRQALLAKAKLTHPGAIVSFETPKGPMRFACDAYEQTYSNDRDEWRANVRAVALTLEALRAIDRWGAAQTGQQYTGWLALPAPEGTTFTTADVAERWLRRKVGELTASSRRPLNTDAMSLRDLYREAAKHLHPDTTSSDPVAWEKLQNARLLLETAKLL